MYKLTNVGEEFESTGGINISVATIEDISSHTKFFISLDDHCYVVYSKPFGLYKAYDMMHHIFDDIFKVLRVLPFPSKITYDFDKQIFLIKQRVFNHDTEEIHETWVEYTKDEFFKYIEGKVITQGSWE